MCQNCRNSYESENGIRVKHQCLRWHGEHIVRFSSESLSGNVATMNVKTYCGEHFTSTRVVKAKV